jgi:hypothetical protein
MDSHRTRRTRDQARKVWYAHCRQVRFARRLGFVGANADPIRDFRDPRSVIPPTLD